MLLHRWRKKLSWLCLVMTFFTFYYGVNGDNFAFAAKAELERLEKLRETAEKLGIDPLLLTDPDAYYAKKAEKQQQKLAEAMPESTPVSPELKALQAENRRMKLSNQRQAIKSLKTNLIGLEYAVNEALKPENKSSEDDFRKIDAYLHTLKLFHQQVMEVMQYDNEVLRGEVSDKPWLTQIEPPRRQERQDDQRVLPEKKIGPASDEIIARHTQRMNEWEQKLDQLLREGKQLIEQIKSNKQQISSDNQLIRDKLFEFRQLLGLFIVEHVKPPTSKIKDMKPNRSLAEPAPVEYFINKSVPRKIKTLPPKDGQIKGSLLPF